MPTIIPITPTFAVAAALGADDFAEVARLGFRTVINTRPDGEEDGQTPARHAARQARAAGLDYSHVPATKLDLFADHIVEAMGDALAGADGPVLAHCKSGQRAAIVWAAAQARAGGNVDTLLERLATAGFDLQVVRDELEAIADGRADIGGAATGAASAAA
jgi:sulfide:quinone oxidoreductase